MAHEGKPVEGMARLEAMFAEFMASHERMAAKQTRENEGLNSATETSPIDHPELA